MDNLFSNNQDTNPARDIHSPIGEIWDPANAESQTEPKGRKRQYYTIYKAVNDCDFPHLGVPGLLILSPPYASITVIPVEFHRAGQLFCHALIQGHFLLGLIHSGRTILPSAMDFGNTITLLPSSVH